jgi:hypothetical protein
MACPLNPALIYSESNLPFLRAVFRKAGQKLFKFGFGFMLMFMFMFTAQWASTPKFGV